MENHHEDKTHSLHIRACWDVREPQLQRPDPLVTNRVQASLVVLGLALGLRR